MNSFSPTKIAETRGFFRAQKFPEIDLPYRGRDYKYFVIPQELNAELPDFLMRMTPPTELIRVAEMPETTAIFGVSNSVREKFRSYAVIHEVEEFMHIGIEEEGRCAKSAQNEIGLVLADQRLSESEKTEYLQMRIEFFIKLQEYAKGSPANFTPEDLREFDASLQQFKTTASAVDLQ